MGVIARIVLRSMESREWLLRNVGFAVGPFKQEIGFLELNKSERLLVVLPVSKLLFSCMLLGLGVVVGVAVQFWMIIVAVGTSTAGASLSFREMCGCAHFGNPSPRAINNIIITSHIRNGCKTHTRTYA